MAFSPNFAGATITGGGPLIVTGAAEDVADIVDIRVILQLKADGKPVVAAGETDKTDWTATFSDTAAAVGDLVFAYGIETRSDPMRTATWAELLKIEDPNAPEPTP